MNALSHTIVKTAATLAVVAGACIAAAPAGACLATVRATLERNPSAFQVRAVDRTTLPLDGWAAAAIATAKANRTSQTRTLHPFPYGLDRFTLPKARGAVAADGFDYADAGIGAAAAAVALLLVGGAAMAMRRQTRTQPLTLP
jgi:hypothetical protein